MHMWSSWCRSAAFSFVSHHDFHHLNWIMTVGIWHDWLQLCLSASKDLQVGKPQAVRNQCVDSITTYPIPLIPFAPWTIVVESSSDKSESSPAYWLPLYTIRMQSSEFNLSTLISTGWMDSRNFNIIQLRNFSTTLHRGTGWAKTTWTKNGC